MTIYIIAQSMYLLFILVGLPVCIIFINMKNDKHHEQPLSLPRGTVRSLLAFSLVGSFLITVSLGPLFIDPDYFASIIAAQSALVGSAVGFYFGSKKV